ncbi:DUF6994 family protein [Salipiger abyssi]|uniref:DUF6994 family protein n=1 Tax=Salipiger abyssi TaxID=1250539 RepID=UPI003AF38A29
MTTFIDTTFDFYSDTPVGRDPDSRSPTLRQYHRYLWSKPLPNDIRFSLSDSHPKTYLYHSSSSGEFFLSSDALGHTYRYWKSMQHIISEIPPTELEAFFRVCSTIGAYIIFPAKMINRQQNINMARGTNSRIKDRFDLTLECIRLHYVGAPNPLSATLQRYGDFFDLFGSFERYTQFFLLQDLIQEGTQDIKFFLPFRGFEGSPIPRNVTEYRSYRDNVTRFVLSRNSRISAFTSNETPA